MTGVKPLWALLLTLPLVLAAPIAQLTGAPIMEKSTFVPASAGIARGPVFNPQDFNRDYVLRYMPEFVLTRDEEYFPTTVSAAWSNMICEENKDLGEAGSCRVVPEYVLENNLVTIGKPSWILGHMLECNEHQDDHDHRCETTTNARIYPFVVPRDNYETVEVHYNVFYGFNVGILGKGLHWEKVAIKFQWDRKSGRYVPWYVYASRHSPFKQSWGGNWTRLKMTAADVDTHPVILVAEGTHANFFQATNTFRLNLPSLFGSWKSWFTSSRIVSATSNLNLCTPGVDFRDLAWEELAKHDAGYSWQPWKVEQQANFTVFCRPWKGARDIQCNFDGHPERASFEKFQDRHWGYGPESGVHFGSPGKRQKELESSPIDPRVQMLWFFSDGLECTALNGWDRPAHCPPVKCKWFASWHTLAEEDK